MYKLKKLFSLILILGLLANTSFKANAGDTNIESWTFIGAHTMLRKMDFSIHSANFFSYSGAGYFLNHTQISLNFPSKSSFYFGVAYKQEYVKSPNHWRTEYRPMLHLFYEKQWGHIKFRDRNRWEFRFIEGEFINRYRNQLQFSLTKFEKITPYFSTEFSLYFNDLGYSRHRTILGTQIPIKSVNLNLFLGHQINEDYVDEWNNQFMIGTAMVYNF
jgi:hypothetical protein